GDGGALTGDHGLVVGGGGGRKPSDVAARLPGPRSRLGPGPERNVGPAPRLRLQRAGSHRHGRGHGTGAAVAVGAAARVPGPVRVGCRTPTAGATRRRFPSWPPTGATALAGGRCSPSACSASAWRRSAVAGRGGRRGARMRSSRASADSLPHGPERHGGCDDL